MTNKQYFTEAEVFERIEVELDYYDNDDLFDWYEIEGLLVGDYYIIGYMYAKEALEEVGVFEVLQSLQDNGYHIENFTNVEEIATMYWDYFVREMSRQYYYFDELTVQEVREKVEEILKHLL